MKDKLQKSVIKIPKMDCPSEEKLIQLAMSGDQSVERLNFDLPARQVQIIHRSNVESLVERLATLNLGVPSLVTNEVVDEKMALHLETPAIAQSRDEARILKILLGINGFMFFFEMALGFFARSTGLIADAMDMFADAAVYGISLYAVGKTINAQKNAARASGYAQVALALFALFEVIRRYLVGELPESTLMMGVSCLALIANVYCLILISKHRSDGIHMKASAIFSANDVIANLGVILAGFLVFTFNSQIPDLVVGLIIGTIVLRGGFTILRLAKNHG